MFAEERTDNFHTTRRKKGVLLKIPHDDGNGILELFIQRSDCTINITELSEDNYRSN